MNFNLKTQIKEGLKHPGKAIQYFILGKEKYDTLYNLKNHSCTSGIIPKDSLESRMIVPTDIHEHLNTLYMLTVELNLKTILELGTRTGESTVAFLQAAKEIDGNVTSMDIDSCNDAKKLISDLDLTDSWKFIQSDDLKNDWKKPIDHLFIDTSHTYEQTLAELEKFTPFVKPGGIITLHDIISCPEVLSAINEYIKDKPHIKFYKFFHNNGLGVLRIKNTE